MDSCGAPALVSASVLCRTIAGEPHIITVRSRHAPLSAAAAPTMPRRPGYDGSAETTSVYSNQGR